jgi:O-antigen/teichoic acid export membrane protein
VGLVGYFGGVAAAGELGIAFRINDAIGSLIGAVTVRMALPVFTRLARLSLAEVRESVLKGQQVTFLVAAPIFVGLAVCSSRLVNLIMGPAWAAAAMPLFAVAMFSVLNFSVVMSAPAAKACGQPKKAAIVPFVGFVWVLVGVIASAHLSVMWQLYVWIGYGAIYFILSSINLRYTLGIPILLQLRNLSDTALCVGMMVIAVLFVDNRLDSVAPLPALVALILSGAITYAISTLILQHGLIKSVLRA